MSADNMQPLSVPAVSGPMKIIQISQSSATGALQEREVTLTAPRFDVQDKIESLSESIRKRAKVQSLQEAATLASFPFLLRDGMKSIMFDEYNQTPSTWQQLAKVVPSDKPAEDYVENNQFGLLPPVGELQAFPEVDGSIDRVIRVANTKRGMIWSVSREMVRFDRLNMIMQYVENLGRAAKLTQEQAVYSVLTTTGNYTRNSTTGDNDVGANTLTATFSAITINTAYATINTMRDRKSGTPLYPIPDTFVCGPRLAQAAKQLFMSPTLYRLGGNSTNDVYGTGQNNVFKDIVSTIIVTPFLGGGSTQYNHILCQAKRGLVYQEVDPFNLLSADDKSGDLTEGRFVWDKLRYRADIFFGVGLVNDRFWYYSDSNTAPIAA